MFANSLQSTLVIGQVVGQYEQHTRQDAVASDPQSKAALTRSGFTLIDFRKWAALNGKVRPDPTIHPCFFPQTKNRGAPTNSHSGPDPLASSSHHSKHQHLSYYESFFVTQYPLSPTASRRSPSVEQDVGIIKFPSFDTSTEAALALPWWSFGKMEEAASFVGEAMGLAGVGTTVVDTVVGAGYTFVSICNGDSEHKNRIAKDVAALGPVVEDKTNMPSSFVVSTCLRLYRLSAALKTRRDHVLELQKLADAAADKRYRRAQKMKFRKSRKAHLELCEDSGGCSLWCHRPKT